MYYTFYLDVQKSEVSATFSGMFWKVAFTFAFSLRKVFIASFLVVTLEIICHWGAKDCLTKSSNDQSSARTNGNWRSIRNFISRYLALLGSYVKTLKPLLEAVRESWVWTVPPLSLALAFHMIVWAYMISSV